jgi:hypothetical protein
MEDALKTLTSKSLAVIAFVVFTPLAAVAQQRIETAAAAPAPAELGLAAQQSNVPAQAREAEDAIERAVRRFRIGVIGGVALDPELIVFGAHGAFGPFFTDRIEFRPGFDFGVGEITTSFGINLDVLYRLPGATRTTRWVPYLGAGPTFGVSHRGFDASGEDEIEEEDRSRFDFGDTDFESGFNFIAGARSQNGVFFELRATAYGVSTVRVIAGYDF